MDKISLENYILVILTTLVVLALRFFRGQYRVFYFVRDISLCCSTCKCTRDSELDERPFCERGSFKKDVSNRWNRFEDCLIVELLVERVNWLS